MIKKKKNHIFPCQIFDACSVAGFFLFLLLNRKNALPRLSAPAAAPPGSSPPGRSLPTPCWLCRSQGMGQAFPPGMASSYKDLLSAEERSLQRISHTRSLSLAITLQFPFRVTAGSHNLQTISQKVPYCMYDVPDFARANKPLKQG